MSLAIRWIIFVVLTSIFFVASWMQYRTAETNTRSAAFHTRLTAMFSGFNVSDWAATGLAVAFLIPLVVETVAVF